MIAVNRVSMRCWAVIIQADCASFHHRGVLLPLHLYATSSSTECAQGPPIGGKAAHEGVVASVVQLNTIRETGGVGAATVCHGSGDQSMRWSQASKAKARAAGV